MPVNSLNQWKSSLQAIPPSADSSMWAQHIANWVLKNSEGMNLILIIPATFTFNSNLFAQSLKSMCRSTEDKNVAARNMAQAWAQAIDASQMTIAGALGFGFSAIVGVGTPINTQSAASLVEKHLKAAPNVIDSPMSHLADAFYKGFLGLQYQVTGVGIPPSAPFPPTAPFIGVSGTL